jgi:hypothetical protein
LLFLCQGATLFSQGNDTHDSLPGQISVLGRIVTADSLFPIRNTHVISKMAHCGTISNRDGIFLIPTKEIDTLWVSCIGYAREQIPIDNSIKVPDTLLIMLTPDTITIREVVIKPFYDYAAFKEMVINMPTMQTPHEIKLLNDELQEMRSGKKTDPYFNVSNGGISVSPIQYFYDNFKKSARVKKKLILNRRLYNDVLREQGRLDELLPDSLEFEVEYRIYENIELETDTATKK